MPTTPNTIRSRQSKPTVRIPVRTLSECAARYTAERGCAELGLPCDIDHNR